MISPWKVLFILVAGFIAGWGWGVRAQDCQEGSFGCGHIENHQKYRNWNEAPAIRNGEKQKDGSCCNGDDCRPVKAIEDIDGHWSVYIPEYRQYIPVPDDRVGQPDRFGDGRNHVCTSKPNQWKSDIQIFCFSPGRVKS